MALNCDENTLRTTPSGSITNVTLPGRIPMVRATPHCLRTLPPASLSRVNGRLCLAAKALWESTESELMPMTTAPASVKSWWLSRNAHDSAVQPGVSSFG